MVKIKCKKGLSTGRKKPGFDERRGLYKFPTPRKPISLGASEPSLEDTFKNILRTTSSKPLSNYFITQLFAVKHTPTTLEFCYKPPKPVILAKPVDGPGDDTFWNF